MVDEVLHGNPCGEIVLDQSERLVIWDMGKVELDIFNLTYTRYAKKLMGFPVPPRKARGWRKHVRRMKARK